MLQARLLWAERRSRFTQMFEHFAVDVLLESSVTGAARILGIQAPTRLSAAGTEVDLRSDTVSRLSFSKKWFLPSSICAVDF